MGHRARRALAPFILTILLTPATLHAQETTVTLTEEQININNRAVGLMEESPPRIDEAIKLVQAAMLMGEPANLLHLTLGRAYQLDGQCEAAAKEFELTEEAPTVEGLPEGYIEQQLTLYRGEMGKMCPGTLLVTCEPGSLELEIGDDVIACGEETSLPAGNYQIDVTNPDTGDTISTQATIVGMSTTETTIKLGSKKSGPDKGPEKPVDPVDPNITERTDIEGRSGVGGRIGVPVGYCLARLINDGAQAQATDGALCYGVQADIGFTRALSSSFSLAGVVTARGVMAHALGQIDEAEPLALRGFDLGGGAQAWMLGQKLGLEFGARWRLRRVVFQDENLTTGAPVMAGPGLLVELGSLLPGIDRLGLGARWLPIANKTNTVAFDANVGKGPLAIWLTYESWSGALVQDPLTHRGEQLLLGVGYTWGD